MNIFKRQYLRHFYKTHIAAKFLCLTILIGCNEINFADPIEEYVSQPAWKSVALPAPVIQAGDGRPGSIWNDPSVIKVGDQYVMYLTSSVDKPFEPPVLPFRAVSQDGHSWELSPGTPLLSPANTPFDSIETPSVVYFNGVYHMYYTGVYPAGSIPSMAIGHATSEDGITWKNDPMPVLEATGEVIEWNGFLVAEPGAVVYKNRIYLYYTAMGARLNEAGTAVGFPEQLQSLGLVISSDGASFDAQRQLLTQSENYPPEMGFVGYSTPAAVEIDGKIHLIYDVAAFVKGAQPEWQQVALHMAVSDDGISNFTEDEQPLLTRKDFSWTSGEILAPTMLLEDEMLKLWFAGHVDYSGLRAFIQKDFKGPEFGIGYAEIPLSRLNSD